MELQQPNQNQPIKIKLSDIYGHNMGAGAKIEGSKEDVLPSVQMLEILMRENSNLKAELVNARRKVNTIHKVPSFRKISSFFKLKLYLRYSY